MKLVPAISSTVCLLATGLIINLWCVDVQAQNYIRARKSGAGSSFVIHEGESFKMRYQGKKTNFDLITADSSGLFLQYSEGSIKLKPSDVSKIWVRRDNMLSKLSGSVTASAPAFLLIFGIAGAINNDNFTNVFSPNFNGVQVMLGLCVVVPVVYAVVKWKKIDCRKWSLLVVDFRHLR